MRSNWSLPHVDGTQLEHAAEDAKALWLSSYPRMTEVMLMQLRQVFLDHPQVDSLSFDIDGDPDSSPIFSCLDSNGQDLISDWGGETQADEDIEALSEGWNANLHPVVPTFLLANENKPFRRQCLVADMLQAVERTVKADWPLPGGSTRPWMASLRRHLAAMVTEVAAQKLDAVLPGAAAKARARPRA